jgi:hypothetical protein
VAAQRAALGAVVLMVRVVGARAALARVVGARAAMAQVAAAQVGVAQVAGAQGAVRLAFLELANQELRTNGYHIWRILHYAPGPQGVPI